MPKRRTSSIQRRQRASEAALGRRLGAPTADAGGLPVDWRILAIIGLVVVGLVVVAILLVLTAGPSPFDGQQIRSDGGGHVADGTVCRADAGACGTDPYSSLPATSGPHWGNPAAWGAYSGAQAESQLVHNLEHGGIVIWYDPAEVPAQDVERLANYVDEQVTSGVGGRFKFIASPWAGEDFGHPIAATAWQYILYLDEMDLDAIRAFADAHYGRAPEPNGGPAP
jgi:Protein of unknown function (DUF3105)